MTKRQAEKIAALIERVKNATSQRGKKTELATFLGTSPQGLNDWLSGRCEPGGEVTLSMLEWVQAEEAKQPKTLASVSSTSKGRKTRSSQSRYEKPKQVRKGK